MIFFWLSEKEIDDLDVQKVADDCEELGYILDVDLEYPPELHDLHSDYPLAPEKMRVTSNLLSPYCQQLNEDLKLGGSAVPKLVPTLFNKNR